MRKILKFSNNLFKAEYLENIDGLTINNYGILVNLDKKPLVIDNSGSISYYKSYLLKDWKVKVKITKAVLISWKNCCRLSVVNRKLSFGFSRMMAESTLGIGLKLPRDTWLIIFGSA